MMDILDENILEEEGKSYPSSPKFLNRLHWFSYISLVNAVLLFAIPFFFAFLVLTGAHINDMEMVLLYIASAFSWIGSALLYRSFHFARRFLNDLLSPQFLEKSILNFFQFWLTLINCFLVLFLLGIGGM